MMASPEYYIFTGRDGEVVPRHVTHVLIDKALKFVPAWAFYNHFKIQEVICHDGVIKIEKYAFSGCINLRRVIMLNVEEVEYDAFRHCRALTSVEYGKLEIIREYSFGGCESLSSIDLPSIKILERYAFNRCTNLINVKFGKDLESIGEKAFLCCTSLERIAIPLKDGMITIDDAFQYCAKLDRIDLLGGARETIHAFLFEEWKNDMNEEIDAINQILPNTYADYWDEVGAKTQAIRTWITSVLRKYVYYKAEHRRILDVAATTLQPVLPNDIVFKNVLPFLELPPHTFQGEE